MYNAKVCSTHGNAVMLRARHCFYVTQTARITAELHSSASSDDNRFVPKDTFCFCLQANLREQLESLVKKSRAQAGSPAVSTANL